MLNFLPADEKKRLKKEYVMRLGVTVLSGLTVTFLIGGVLLLPAFYLSKARENAYIDQSALTENSSTTDEEDALYDMLQGAQKRIDILAVRDKNIPLKTVFDTILMHRKSGVEITGLFYTKNDTVVILTVDGVADTREDLLAFSRALENDPLFSDSELPVSNLAKDKDISFKLTIQGDF